MKVNSFECGDCHTFAECDSFAKCNCCDSYFKSMLNNDKYVCGYCFEDYAYCEYRIFYKRQLITICQKCILSDKPIMLCNEFNITNEIFEKLRSRRKNAYLNQNARMER